MGRTIKKVLLGIFETILSLLSLILFVTTILPIFTVVFLVFYIWRWILVVYVKLYRKNYARIMGGKNPVVAIDDMYTRPLCTIVGMGAFDGQLDLNTSMSYVKNVIEAKDTITGKLLYPESHQYYEEWNGFIWWKWVKEFSVEKHVTLWNQNQNEVSEDDFIQIISQLEAKPFARKMSPWEVVVVQNLRLKRVADENKLKTAVVFRFHHGFADGIAMLQVFMRFVFEDSFEKVARPVFVKRNRIQKKLHQVIAALQLPYQFFKQGIVAYDSNAWHLPEHKLSRKIFKAWTLRIPTQWIKTTKQHHKVGFTAVLLAGISGALRKIMLENQITIPKKMHCILPLPFPGHPPGFCNHWSYGFIGLPVGTELGKERLRKCNKYVEELKESPSPAVNFAILAAFNQLPTWLIRRTTLTNYFPTVILSNFPGPPPDTEGVGGYALVDACFTGGPLRGSIGISITILSYDGALRIVVGVDKAIFPNQNMANNLSEAIEEQFYELRYIGETV